jgi:hypothetical protein
MAVNTYICFINIMNLSRIWPTDCVRGPPLWSSGQSSWLQIQRSGIDSRYYQIFWEVVCLERGLLASWVELRRYLKRKSSGYGLESRDYGRWYPPCWLRDTLLSSKVGTNFVDKRRSLGRYNSFADLGHGVCLVLLCFYCVTDITTQNSASVSEVFQNSCFPYTLYFRHRRHRNKNSFCKHVPSSFLLGTELRIHRYLWNLQFSRIVLISLTIRKCVPAVFLVMRVLTRLSSCFRWFTAVT